MGWFFKANGQSALKAVEYFIRMVSYVEIEQLGGNMRCAFHYAELTNMFLFQKKTVWSKSNKPTQFVTDV